MNTTLERKTGYWRGTFEAMAGPCEVLVDVDSRARARDVVEAAAQEAARIEGRLSRYRDDNVVHAINTSGGAPIEVDDETADLLDFAGRCFHLSAGLFDVTSGVLRHAWRFDGSDNVPSPEEVAALLPLVGWQNVVWERPRIRLPAGMEIDFGGVGKEYAVDRCVALIDESFGAPALVNFGGDLHASAPHRDGAGWTVGVETPDADEASRVIDIRRGGLATSGDARRFLLKDGVRYSHVLDPRTGAPIKEAPRSVTVLGDTCTEAGLLATLALLQGPEAEVFLETQGVRHWVAR